MAGSVAELWVKRLVAEVPVLKPLYDDHMAQNDELLPHVFVGAMTRLVEETVARASPPSHDVGDILRVLERAVASRDPSVAELALSFLEDLDPNSPGYQRLRSMMGPRLLGELARYENE